MLGNLLGSQFNKFNPVHLHFIVGFEMELDLIDVFVSVELYHFHYVSSQLPRYFFLESLALFWGPDEDRLLSLDLHVPVGERQYLDQGHPHVLVEGMAKQVLFGSD